MKIMCKILTIFLFILIFISCNKAKIHNYDFRIKNNTKETITARYLKAFQSGNEIVTDILPGDESVLYSETTETNQKKVYDLYVDSVTYFRSISAIKTATGLPTRNNVKARNQWNFNIVDDNNAIYVLQLDSFDF